MEKQGSDSLFQKALAYLKKHGWKKTVRKTWFKYFGANSRVSYRRFLRIHRTTEEDLKRQRKEVFPYAPLISVAVPLYRTKEFFLRELIDSVRGQTYPNWELCLADGSGAGHSLEDKVKLAAEGDGRIRYRLLESNKGIAENTNAAFAMAKGEFVALADHDDVLAPEALWQCAKVLNEETDVDVIYSDEDKTDMAGKKYFDPYFKSDFNPDLLRSNNYICHLFVFRRELLERVGMMESCCDGAQDHDFILRSTEAARRVFHIPKVLYHWRSHEESTSFDPESKSYAFENGKAAVQAHLDRIGLPAKAERGEDFFTYRVRYRWKGQPLLSIVIPNRDHSEDLKRCIGSIEERSAHKNYEFVIVENNSERDETFRLYEELKKRANVTVLSYRGEFNFSAVNNLGAKCARGEYLLLLNNDTEMIAPDGLKDMLDICRRGDVGIVGAQLFYPDDTVQHAGAVIGLGGIAGHAFLGETRGESGYFFRMALTQDLSAVTAACMLTKKSVFRQAGGFSEEFPVAFNDMDYCMKVRALGKLIVYDPYATFYHYESKSRGQDDTPEKEERFKRETELFEHRWRDILERGDPYYNRNLTLVSPGYRLKALR